MSATLDKIIAEAKALTPDELQQLRSLVNSLLSGETPKPHMTEDEFEKYLAAKGVISLPESSNEAGADNDNWQPVEVTGQPLSEIIVEDRC
jgi:hypothetical protein